MSTSGPHPLADRVNAPAQVAEPHHPDVSHWRPATRDDTDAIWELAQVTDAVDHPTWATPRDEIDDIFELSHIVPERDTRLGFDADGTLVAMAGIMVHPSQDVHVHVYFGGKVHPRARRRGIGRAVARWQYESALTALAETGSTLPGAVFQYAPEQDAGARAIAAGLGMIEERWFTSMVRDLAQPIAEVALDPGLAVKGSGAAVEGAGLEIVPFGAQWAEATRIARNDAFRDHWGSLETPPERWERFVTGPHLRPDLSRIVVDGDRVVAIALASVNEDDWPLQGYTSAYVDLIGVVRDHRGRRLAPAVITAMLKAVRDAGLERAVLDVDTESPTGANSLYGALGFEATVRDVAMVARF